MTVRWGQVPHPAAFMPHREEVGRKGRGIGCSRRANRIRRIHLQRENESCRTHQQVRYESP